MHKLHFILYGKLNFLFFAFFVWLVLFWGSGGVLFGFFVSSRPKLKPGHLVVWGFLFVCVSFLVFIQLKGLLFAIYVHIFT